MEQKHNYQRILREYQDLYGDFDEKKYSIPTHILEKCQKRVDKTIKAVDAVSVFEEKELNEVVFNL